MLHSKPKICVVGSSNYDLIAYTDRLPKLGETIHGDRFQMGFGGKGANQAVTAAKLGADVTMITKLGKDIFGEQTLENFKSLAINTDHVYFTNKASSGVAPISVDKEGNNSIIVVAGANNLLSKSEVESARETIAKSNVLICQMEISLETTIRALEIAKEEGVTTIFNPAPAPADGLPEKIYKLTDIFCPNETETALLTGLPTNSLITAEEAGLALINKGLTKVLMTLGKNGSLLITENYSTHIPTNDVKVLDTTGAGDCFIGSFAYFLAGGFSELEAIKKASYVASISVSHTGTQTSFPLSSELPKELF